MTGIEAREGSGYQAGAGTDLFMKAKIYKFSLTTIFFLQILTTKKYIF